MEAIAQALGARLDGLQSSVGTRCCLAAATLPGNFATLGALAMLLARN